MNGFRQYKQKRTKRERVFKGLPYVKAEPTPPRNGPCPCGSVKTIVDSEGREAVCYNSQGQPIPRKFKHCCKEPKAMKNGGWNGFDGELPEGHPQHAVVNLQAGAANE